MTLLLDVLTAVGILTIVVLGLAIVLGVLDVINLAHTGFMAVGVYASVIAHQAGWPFWTGILAGAAAAAVTGLVVEVLVIRRLYDRPLETILATWGISLIIIQALTLGFGHDNQAVGQPMATTTSLAGTPYPTYRFMLILLAAALVVALAVLMRFTRVGLTIRMVQSNQHLARALGIRVALIRAVTFVVGCALSGFAGAVLGPTQAVTPNYALSLVATGFLAVLLAGGRLSGVVTSCLVLGVVQILFAHWASPIYSSTAVIAVAVVLLRIRPEGLTWRHA
ncbi:branched-chain amino acid ABC transporter permease [Streptomyces sp. NBC_01717]|uniref:branched-chain amino acid ABC transporter permease n=1 Tax=Streptomyces sp. NBC_01717 TaxID=2975918 RepID=UPI002E36BE24|nr:branched-chain amino acid ABC transporter permease [Streptomyces sp. NBC_01717]